MVYSILDQITKSGFSVSDNVADRIKRIELYDLDFVSQNFIDKGRRFSPEQVWPIKIHFGKADYSLAKKLEWEFKKFAALSITKPGKVYAPSGPVDMFWHFFVLHTRQYAHFCREIWCSISESHNASIEHSETSSGSQVQEIVISDINIIPDSAKKDLSPQVLKQLSILESYDLSEITENLIDRGRLFAPEQVWPIKAHFERADIYVARILEREFKRFVALTLISPGITFGIAGPVDMYWHFLILPKSIILCFLNCD